SQRHGRGPQDFREGRIALSPRGHPRSRRAAGAPRARPGPRRLRALPRRSERPPLPVAARVVLAWSPHLVCLLHHTAQGLYVDEVLHGGSVAPLRGFPLPTMPIPATLRVRIVSSQGGAHVAVPVPQCEAAGSREGRAAGGSRGARSSEE